MSVTSAYEAYRQHGEKGWGLAWYLSMQLCRRYYISHGIAPYVIEHSGVGYYGIELHQLHCVENLSNGGTVRLGRFTAAGNVENWRTGSPGDHGCELVERAERGEALSTLVRDAIGHLDLPTRPGASHAYCHHKRRGQSFVLLWEVAALLALRHEHRMAIWNSFFQTEGLAKRYDPDHAPKPGRVEPPDYFFFESSRGKVMVRGDGQVILPVSSGSFWERYMRGESADDLARWVEQVLF